MTADCPDTQPPAAVVAACIALAGAITGGCLSPCLTFWLPRLWKKVRGKKAQDDLEAGGITRLLSEEDKTNLAKNASGAYIAAFRRSPGVSRLMRVIDGTELLIAMERGEAAAVAAVARSFNDARLVPQDSLIVAAAGGATEADGVHCRRVVSENDKTK
ncbi:hypothetical protein GGR51DRAFT_555126 [Nemania sp. FL0031]|nr:hypothetical protein GGR51DRAFT_555126 [Nemania sp. FL0031]